jgi:DNA-binding CsgD family transcriptional regulator
MSVRSSLTARASATPGPAGLDEWVATNAPAGSAGPLGSGGRFGPEADLLGTEVTARVRDVVDAALETASAGDDPRARARACAQLLALLHEQVMHVTANRDAALLNLLLELPESSNRELAKRLNISRQRVDQLKKHLRAGGRQPCR